ncbi:hypothetical protein Fcan01_10447 [Folsomia candida]|uniref:Uncharacterized protein n=1 Tax=Folsomia candida TaxID=158441 RepID=A0A226EAY5_FOLCA|nr:hypothetical protein Fcan01_10447 [Folsomia candida]
MNYISNLFLCFITPTVSLISIVEHFLDVPNPGTLQFIFASDIASKADFEQIQSYLAKMIRQNNRSPVLVHRLLYDPELIDETTISFLERNNRALFSQARYTVLHVISTNMTFTDYKQSQTLFMANVLLYDNPTYIFLIVRSPISRNYYRYYPNSNGNSILIIITDTLLFIPCIVCRDLPPNEQIQGLNGLKIDQIWKSRNNDMQGKSVTLVISVTSWSPVEAKCGHNIINYYESNPPHRCVISVLTQRYNFTVIPTMGKFNMDNFVGRLSFRQYLNNGFITRLANERALVYKVTFSEIEFVIVTDHPTLRNDFAVFLYPFDAPTWTLIFLSAIGITIVGRLGLRKVGHQNSSMFSDVLRISSILLGQVEGNTLKLFKSKRIAWFLLPVWFGIA